jgi:hypothetical protein
VTSVDLADVEEVVDQGLLDRLFELQVEQNLPVYVIPLQPVERVLAEMQKRPARFVPHRPLVEEPILTPPGQGQPNRCRLPSPKRGSVDDRIWGNSRRRRSVCVWIKPHWRSFERLPTKGGLDQPPWRGCGCWSTYAWKRTLMQQSFRGSRSVGGNAAATRACLETTVAALKGRRRDERAKARFRGPVRDPASAARLCARPSGRRLVGLPTRPSHR